MSNEQTSGSEKSSCKTKEKVVDKNTGKPSVSFENSVEMVDPTTPIEILGALKAKDLDTDLGKSSASLRKTINNLVSSVPVKVSEVSKEEVSDTTVGKSNGLGKTVDTFKSTIPVLVSEVSKKKSSRPIIRGISDSLEKTVENLVQQLGKPYVKRKRRKRYPGETEEQREKRLETARLRLALHMQSMNEKEKEEYCKRKRILSKLRQIHETPEERGKRLADKRLRCLNEDEEVKALRYAKAKAKKALFYASETPEQREERRLRARLKERANIDDKRREIINKRSRDRLRNMSETEREAFLAKRRARDARRRRRNALEKQKTEEQTRPAPPVSYPASKPLTSLPPKGTHSGPIKYISDITIEPDVSADDHSFYNYVYNEIQPFMMHFNGNQQFVKERQETFN